MCYWDSIRRMARILEAENASARTWYFTSDKTHSKRLWLMMRALNFTSGTRRELVGHLKLQKMWFMTLWTVQTDFVIVSVKFGENRFRHSARNYLSFTKLNMTDDRHLWFWKCTFWIHSFEEGNCCYVVLKILCQSDKWFESYSRLAILAIFARISLYFWWFCDGFTTSWTLNWVLG